jgi:TPR repeat protein
MSKHRRSAQLPQRIAVAMWSQRMDSLRERVLAGEIAAMSELGITLADGIRSARGRVLVRRNAPYAVRLLRRAADGGDALANSALGYAYDVGNGVRSDKAAALRWYKRAVRRGIEGAASNIGTLYRDQGHLARAHRWALRAAKMGDGDAAVTAGYNYLYGIGTRRSTRKGRGLLKSSLRANTTEHGREEAQYHLASSDIESGQLKRGLRQLKRANKDGDYPEAEDLINQLKARTAPTPCLCRRHMWKHIIGHAPCSVHPARKVLGKRPRP